MKRKLARLIILFFVFAPGRTVFAGPKPVSATVIGIDFTGMLHVKPSIANPLPSGIALGEISVLYQGKEIGKMSGPEQDGNEIAGLWVPDGQQKIAKGMTVVLLIPGDATAAGDILNLQVTSVFGDQIQLSGGSDQGVRTGDRFAIYASEVRIAEAEVEEVESDRAFAHVTDKWGDISAGDAASKIPPTENLPRGFRRHRRQAGGGHFRPANASKGFMVQGQVFLENPDRTTTVLGGCSLMLVSAHGFWKVSKTNGDGRFKFGGIPFDQTDRYWIVCQATAYKITGIVSAEPKAASQPAPLPAEFAAGDYLSTNQFKSYIITPANYSTLLISWHVPVDAAAAQGYEIDLSAENEDPSFSPATVPDPSGNGEWVR